MVERPVPGCGELGGSGRPWRGEGELGRGWAGAIQGRRLTRWGALGAFLRYPAGAQGRLSGPAGTAARPWPGREWGSEEEEEVALGEGLEGGRIHFVV